jgi:hypothetical protein
MTPATPRRTSCHQAAPHARPPPDGSGGITFDVPVAMDETHAAMHFGETGAESGRPPVCACVMRCHGLIRADG